MVFHDLSAICNSFWNLYGLSRGFFISKVCSFTFSLKTFLLPHRQLLNSDISHYSVFLILYNMLVVRTFLSVILWGTPLRFDWNLLLFLLRSFWIICFFLVSICFMRLL